jgi:hypothetical protein
MSLLALFGPPIELDIRVEIDVANSALQALADSTPQIKIV